MTEYAKNSQENMTKVPKQNFFLLRIFYCNIKEFGETAIYKFYEQGFFKKSSQTLENHFKA